MSEQRLTQFSVSAGCGAKIGPGVLTNLVHGLPKYPNENLLVGYDSSDDACVYDLGNGSCLIQTVDFFPPMVDDPYTYGQIAAANALSDVYAMGGEPKLALNLLCYPTCLTLETVKEILAGGHDKAIEAGCVIAGGHTIEDVSPKYGLCVTGFADRDKILTNSGAKAGDALVLTKPLGVGILVTALKAGLLSEADYQGLVEVMTTLNRGARDCMQGLEVHACTDVTGFSLMGHGREMAKGSGATLVIQASQVPILPSALEFAMMGFIPAGAYRNRDFMEGKMSLSPEVPLHLSDVLFDPQTSGGLLISLPEPEANMLVDRLSSYNSWARVIGYVKERGEKDVEVIL